MSMTAYIEHMYSVFEEEIKALKIGKTDMRLNPLYFLVTTQLPTSGRKRTKSQRETVLYYECTIS